VELKTYIPAAFRPYLRLKNDHAGNEHRRISILALNIEMGYDQSDQYSLTMV
jgi:hypothetical protein